MSPIAPQFSHKKHNCGLYGDTILHQRCTFCNYHCLLSVTIPTNRAIPPNNTNKNLKLQSREIWNQNLMDLFKRFILTFTTVLFSKVFWNANARFVKLGSLLNSFGLSVKKSTAPIWNTTLMLLRGDFKPNGQLSIDLI